MNMHMTLPNTGQVDLSCPIETEPAGGLERLRAAGIQLTDHEFALCRAAAAEPAPEGMATLFAYPAAVELLTTGKRHVNLIGRCPYCGILHNHGLSADMRRQPMCTEGLPPFVDGRKKPNTFYVIPVLDVLPEDLRFDLNADKGNLLNLAAMAFQDGNPGAARASRLLTLKGLARDAKSVRRVPWTPAKWWECFEALMASGIFDERLAIMIVDDGAEPEAAAKQLLARFIRSQGNWPMRRRVALSLMAAHKIVARYGA